jgi:hypothetical protein
MTIGVVDSTVIIHVFRKREDLKLVCYEYIYA